MSYAWRPRRWRSDPRANVFRSRFKAQLLTLSRAELIEVALELATDCHDPLGNPKHIVEEAIERILLLRDANMRPEIYE